MKAIKDIKGTHNGGYVGPIYRNGTKEERKIGLRIAKGIRHKLKMCIPLTEIEKEISEYFGITKEYRISMNICALICSYFKEKTKNK